MKQNNFLIFKLLNFCIAAMLLTACQNDDTDFSAYTENTTVTIHITYNGASATVTGDSKNYVTVSGADVTVNSGSSSDSIPISRHSLATRTNCSFSGDVLPIIYIREASA